MLIGENPFNIELLWQRRCMGERHDFPSSEFVRDAGDQRVGDGIVGHRWKGDGPADLQLARR